MKRGAEEAFLSLSNPQMTEDALAGARPFSLAVWLFFVALLVFVMVLVGGITRLTESGLSIVDWRPVTGILPPLNAEAWMAEFAKYQTSPEFILKNAHMTLEDFKGIFYWEWGHRLLGRLIGLAFFVPLVFFWWRRQIPEGYGLILIALFMLGGSQGLLGWYMVKSGLVDEPAVSHYRLAAHLMLALFIFSGLFYTGLRLLLRSGRGSRHLGPNLPEKRAYLRYLQRFAVFILAVLGYQIFMGAMVAGLKAGHIYNEWPLMGGHFFPDNLLDMRPVWRNALDNAASVQFLHRMGAYGLVFLLTVFAYKARHLGSFWLRIGGAPFFVGIIQILIGIATLLEGVPVFLGALHQFFGVSLLAVMIFSVFTLMNLEGVKNDG